MNSIPIILLVSERSGSNLLRTLIGNHSNISAPVAPHLMAEFYDYRYLYGDLKDSNNRNEIIKDMLKVVNHEYHDWALTEKCVSLGKNRANSVVSMFDLLYSAKASQEGKIHYCSKGIHSFKYIDAFRAELKNVKFIHLVRDPRDHVASWMKRPIQLLSSYDAILKWVDEQRIVLDAVRSRGLNCISIRYEDLIEDTSKTMTKVLEYLGVPIDENCFTTHSGNVESKRNPYWQNLSEPILRGNTKKYLKQLSQRDVLIIESIAKNEMKQFGYDLDTEADWKPEQNFKQILLAERRSKLKIVEKNRINEPMTALRSKWAMIDELRNRRLERYVQKYPRFVRVGPHVKEQRDSFVKRRLQYLAYGLLGFKITNRIFKQ